MLERASNKKGVEKFKLKILLKREAVKTASLFLLFKHHLYCC